MTAKPVPQGFHSRWGIATRIEDISVEEMQRRMDDQMAQA